MNSKLAISELYRYFKLLNEHFYNGELEEPYIVITSTIKQSAYGWFTPNKVWRTEEETVAKHEIALSAEYMHRDPVDIIGTLHHEMIHLYCHMNNIKDTSRQGRYHNKNFKRECEARGLVFDQEEPHPTYGWSFTKLTDETRELIKEWGLKEEAFSLARAYTKKTSQPKKKSNMVTYICECENKLRAKRGLNISCNDCGEIFVEKE